MNWVGNIITKSEERSEYRYPCIEEYVVGHYINFANS